MGNTDSKFLFVRVVQIFSFSILDLMNDLKFLQHLDILKQENQRLKDENGALIRVISKLSK